MSAHALRSSSALQLMNSTMSGWSALSTTILAARRVLPPDLITPADASAARMNDTGPEAVPPPPRRSLDERKRERFTPDPEPPLKMMPSLRYQSRIESIVSSTDRMKQAEHWGFGSTPTLNQTGLLKESFCCRSRWVSSSSKTRRSDASAKYPRTAPHSPIVETTRPMSWRTLCSRCGVPRGPRKYFDTTTLVASCDHDRGTSTSRCSKTVSPPSPWITAERTSHSTSSYGFTPAATKCRVRRSPAPRPARSAELFTGDVVRPASASSRPCSRGRSMAIVTPPHRLPDIAFP